MDLLQQIVDQAPFGIVRIGENGGIEEVNRAFCRFVGYNHTELIGKDYLTLIRSADAHRFLNISKKLERDWGGSFKLEQRYLRNDGRPVWGLVNASVAHGEDSDKCSLILYISDITEEKSSSIESERWQDVFEHAHWGVVVGSADGKVLEQMNQEFAHMHGYTVQELLRRPIADVFAPECRDELAEQINFAHRLGHHTFESTHLRKDGSRFPVLVDVTAVRKANREVKYRVVNVQDLSRIKATEKALQHFAAIVESSDDAIVGKTLDGIVTSWNRGAEKIFGYRADEIIGQSIRAIIPKDRLGDEETIISRIRNNEIVKNYETVRRSKSGRLIDISVTVSPIRDASGRITGISKVAKDITERRRAERAVADAERQLWRLVENIPDPIARFDAECRHSYVNTALLRMFDAQVTDFIGKTAADVRLLDAQHEYTSIDHWVKRSFAEGKLYHTEAKWKVGSDVRYFDIVLIPEKDEHCSVVSVLSIARDITHRKQMEEELLYREHKFKTLAENSPNIILRHDRDCRCVYVNPAYAKATGISANDEDSIDPDTQWKRDSSIPVAEYIATLKEVLASGRPSEIIAEWSRLDNDDKTVHDFYITAEYSPDGQVLGALVIGHNITELKKAEKRLEESHSQLRGLAARLETIREEERKRLARDMHDELGQYLTALRMRLSVLRTHIDPCKPALMGQVEELDGLVKKTMSIVKKMAASLRPAPLDMGIISALEWLAEQFTKLVGIPCELETDEEEIILNDKCSTAIFRMVQEALTNVSRHAFASHVEISLKRQGDNCLLTVSDNGKGFCTSAQHSDSFGLVGMRERTIMLDGKLYIDSEIGKGTTIKVTLPMLLAENIDD